MTVHILSPVTVTVSATEPTLMSMLTVALNDPNSGLKFTPTNGSFVVHVTQKDSGLDTSTLVPINLGAASGTSLNSLAASSVVDFAALSGKSADPAAFLKLSRRMTLVWGSVLILFGLLPWGHLLEAGLRVASLPFGSLLGLFLLGTFDSRANATGSI